ncbi:MAG: 50S ribosome-binding GTPase [Verrucomicrobiaceae bacterium]|nr:50S ribosome-binding GTPase [Verrucomicrobiaceae bacterium]
MKKAASTSKPKVAPPKPSAKKTAKAGSSAAKGLKSQSILKIVEKLIALMSHPKSGVSPEEIERFRAKVTSIWNYTPTVCVFGMTGAGKSSLCNALFGDHLFETSAVQACTMQPQEHTVEFHDKRKLTVIDMPGVGESDEADARYQALYEESVKKADLVLWALKADARNYAADQRTWKLVGKRLEELEIPAFFLFTQADKTDPSDSWNKKRNEPGESQMGHLLLKRQRVAKDFKVAEESILFVSASKNYGLRELVLTLLLALPDEKKTGFLESTRSENRSEDAQKAASKGFWNSILGWCKESAASVGKFLWENRKEVIEIAGMVAAIMLKVSGSRRPRKG